MDDFPATVPQEFGSDLLLRILPHRHPFLMLDRVLEWEDMQRLVALKQVSIGEPHFVGHFPSRAIMPGVLIVEALAQACATLMLISNHGMTTTFPHLYLAGLDKTRFKRAVVPGDCLRLEVELKQKRSNVARFAGRATVASELAATAELITAMGE